MRDRSRDALEGLFDEHPSGHLLLALADPADARTLLVRAVNPAAAALLGVADEALSGRPLAEALPELAASGHLGRLAEVARGAGPRSFRVELARGDRTALVECRAFRLESGALVVALERFGEREAAALRERVEFYRAILDELPLPLFVKDVRDDMRYVEMNRGSLAIVGLPREQVLGRTDYELQAGEPAARMRETDAEAMRTRKPVEIPPEPFVNPGGEVRTMRTVKIPVLDASGEPRSLLVIGEDLTEHMRAEQLHRAQLNLRETIRELMTPVLPIHAGVLVAPLVGYVDTPRSAQFMETLLAAISHHRAETVIIDITGVPIVDTAVANHLMQAARAAELLGARCILVGVSAAIAQTIVQSGVDLGSLTIHRDLSAGVAVALARKRS